MARGFQLHGGGCDIAGTTASARSLFVGDAPSGAVVAGEPFVIHPQIRVTTTVPITPYCAPSSDDSYERYDEALENEDEGWGCGGRSSSSNDSTSSCNGTWVTSTWTYTYEIPVDVTAVCTSGCTAVVGVDESVTITAQPETTPSVRITARSSVSGESFATNILLTVVPNVPRIAAMLTAGPEVPANVFLPDQSFTWCLVGPTTLEPLATTGVATGPLEVGSGAGSCPSFHATASGTAHVTLTDGDGKTAERDVTIIDPSQIVELQFVDASRWTTSYVPDPVTSVDDLVAAAPPLTGPIENGYEVCGTESAHGTSCTRATAVRFLAAGGFYGLAPKSAVTIDAEHGLAIAKVGTVSTSVPASWIQN